jgi:excisionase family DNA binding protein
MTTIPEVKFLTPQEIADTLRISNMTAYRLIHNGELAAHRIGRSLRIDPRDFADFMRDNYAVGDE